MPFSSRRQHGITLIIAMVMLVVIGLISVAIMRNATSSGQVATNNRLQTQANQFAQLALSFCEHQILATGSEKVVTIFNPPTPAAWTQKANWAGGGANVGSGTNAAYTLQTANINGSVQPAVMPQCMVEKTTDPSGALYTVTARGFSDDFRADANTAATVSGSVVWLQSTVYAPPNS
jgi:Tfp pilus assembly protein PilX